MNAFLSPVIKSSIVELALAGIVREFPHKLDHVLHAAEDARTPAELHPAFHGCYDWHSAVHSHWALLVLLRDPAVAGQRSRVMEQLDCHFSEALLAAELDYALQPGRQGFERPYGWAWFWALEDAVSDLTGEIPQAALWQARLAPLGRLFMDRWIGWLSRQVYPCRQGTHANTAFALSLALDHAVKQDSFALRDTLREQALRLFGEDTGFSLRGEPSANDFLSPVLSQAALLARCMSVAEWQAWWSAFLPTAAGGILLEPAIVRDRSDAQGVHLDGLNLSRAWHAAEVARFLGGGGQALPWKQLARTHWDAGILHLRTGDFLGEHWLGTFALAAGSALEAA